MAVPRSSGRSDGYQPGAERVSAGIPATNPVSAFESQKYRLTCRSALSDTASQFGHSVCLARVLSEQTHNGDGSLS